MLDAKLVRDRSRIGSTTEEGCLTASPMRPLLCFLWGFEYFISRFLLGSACLAGACCTCCSPNLHSYRLKTKCLLGPFSVSCSEKKQKKRKNRGTFKTCPDFWNTASWSCAKPQRCHANFFSPNPWSTESKTRAFKVRGERKTTRPELDRLCAYNKE